VRREPAASPAGPCRRELTRGLTRAAPETRKAPYPRGASSTATGIRTRVSAMRGRRPSPLDDSGAQSAASRLAKRSGRHQPPALSQRRARSAGRRQGRRGSCDIFASRPLADVAELVDAHGSGPCLGDQVEVRVLSSASQNCRRQSAGRPVSGQSCDPSQKRERSR
jgi:hypothetical protein